MAVVGAVAPNPVAKVASENSMNKQQFFALSTSTALRLTLAVACVSCLLLVSQPSADAVPKGTAALKDIHKEWGKLNKQSGKYDNHDTGRPDSGASPKGKVLRDKEAGEKREGVKYSFSVDGVGCQQTKTQQGGQGTKPWDGVKKQDGIDQLPTVPVRAMAYAKVQNFRAQTKRDRGQSPEAMMAGAQAAMHSQGQGASEATAEGTCAGLEQALELLKMPFPNIANEATGGGIPAPNSMFRTLPESIAMVMTAYKNIYLPIALLLLLPGAVLTQLKSLASVGMLGAGHGGEDSNPLAGIFRSTVAIALIPATQLIVSYSIDVGNSLTHELSRHISAQGLIQAAKAVQQNSNEAELYGDQAFHMVQNMMDMFLVYGLFMLIAFQIVIMCYLFLMGPIAAAFYAWPAGVAKLFKSVFNNWADAIVTVSLWKFWWCLLVLVMLLRIEWLSQMGLYDPKSLWEGFMFTAFLVMLSYVPFAPFELRPGEMVDKVMEKAEKMGSGAAKGRG